MTGDTVLLISDIHTKYEVINPQIRHAEESCGHPVSQVLVLGDFGFFGDELHDYFRRGNNRFLRPVACIEGNHEDHGALRSLADRYSDVVTYLPRGTVHRLGPWRGICLGGARYMDAGATPRGCEITNAGLGHIKTLPSLRKLHIENTKVSRDGLIMLEYDLPDCDITV